MEYSLANNQIGGMNAIAAGVIVLSILTAAVGAGKAQQHAQLPPNFVPAPVGHPELTPTDIAGANQTKSEENALAKVIEQENERLDRLVKGICRGC
jgi:hypothetical protein